MNKELAVLLVVFSTFARSAGAQIIRVETAPIPLSFGASAAAPLSATALPSALTAGLALTAPSLTPMSAPAPVASPAATPVASLTALARPATSISESAGGRFAGWYDGSVQKKGAVDAVAVAAAPGSRSAARLLKGSVVIVGVLSAPLAVHAAQSGGAHASAHGGSAGTAAGALAVFLFFAALVSIKPALMRWETRDVRRRFRARSGVTRVALYAGETGTLDGPAGTSDGMTLYFSDQASLDADMARGPESLELENGSYYKIFRSLDTNAKHAGR